MAPACQEYKEAIKKQMAVVSFSKWPAQWGLRNLGANAICPRLSLILFIGKRNILFSTFSKKSGQGNHIHPAARPRHNLRNHTFNLHTSATASPEPPWRSVGEIENTIDFWEKRRLPLWLPWLAPWTWFSGDGVFDCRHNSVNNRQPNWNCPRVLKFLNCKKKEKKGVSKVHPEPIWI